MRIGLVAEPWWVNLAVLIPVGAYFYWRRSTVPITVRQLIIVGVFAAGFGFIEASVVVYLRAAAGLLPGYQGTLADVIRSSGLSQSIGQPQSVTEVPRSLLTLEVLREAATLVVLIAVALLASVKSRARIAVFLWAFAIWDTIYYAALWATVRWPHSIRDPDVLFLIPEPWFAPVWFPLLVSGLALLAVLLTRANPTKA